MTRAGKENVKNQQSCKIATINSVGYIIVKGFSSRSVK